MIAQAEAETNPEPLNPVERVALGSPRLSKKTLKLGNDGIFVSHADEGVGIDTTRAISGALSYRDVIGGELYTDVVELNSALKNRNLSGSKVAENEQWQPETLPPGVEVINFDHDDATRATWALDGIENIQKVHGLMGYLDPVVCRVYQKFDEAVAAQQITEAELATYRPVALLRAGYEAIKVAGFPDKQIIPIVAKRLNSVVDPDRIAIGLGISEEVAASLKGADICIRERAIASMSSILAFLSVLIARDCAPRNILLIGTVGSQQGVELALEFAREHLPTGSHMTIRIGRLCYHLTGGDHPYYLVSVHGNFSVGDGGNFSDLLLPPAMRKIWPGVLGVKELAALRAYDQSLVRDLTEGTVLTLGLAIKLRNKMMSSNRPEATIYKLGELLNRQGDTYSYQGYQPE